MCAWVREDKAQAREQNISRALAAAGYVCASINYRLGDKAWPTNLYDCKNAVRFLWCTPRDWTRSAWRSSAARPEPIWR